MNTLADIIKQLVAMPIEEEWFEFKTNWFEARSIGEYISALSNAAALKGQEYGYLVWGVEDGTHEIVGTSFDFRRKIKGEPFEHYLARQITPDVAFSFDEDIVKGCRVVVLKVPAAKGIPTAFGGVRYLRIGSSKVNLKKYPERESELFEVLRSGLPSIDNSESKYQDLEFERLFTYYAGKGITLRRETFEKNLGLRTKDGKYNVLAQLLSDDSHIPVRVSIFQGTDKASPLFSVKEFGNTCLLLSLDKVLEYGDVINLVQTDERDRTVVRKETPLFDPNVYREAVINAFVHNQWIQENAPMITVFSDRMEILSRGTLAPDQTIEGFFHGESIPVNQKLSDIFLQLHISERSGRGVPKITKAYGRDAFEFRQNSIVLTIPFDRITQSPMNQITDAFTREQASLNQTQQRILDEIRNDPNITQPNLARVINLGETTIYKGIAYLKKNGFIERMGSNKDGYWRVL